MEALISNHQLDNIAPPYYAVIFISEKKNDIYDYAAMADKMEQLAKNQPGYLGIKSAPGIKITRRDRHR